MCLYKSKFKSPKISDDFLDWFVGFIEADGCFSTYVSFNQTHVDGKHVCTQHYRVQLVIQLAEKNVLYKIKNTLHMGTIRPTNNGYWRYVISDKKHIAQIICWINGRIHMQKRHEQFVDWVDVFKQSVGQNNAICLPPVCASLVLLNLNNAWFRGFIDGEGCFQISIQKNNHYQIGYRTRLRFILDQKDRVQLLDQVVQHFHGCYRLRKTSKVHRYEQTNLCRLSKIINYIDNFNLQTRKNVIYQRWKIRVEIALKKQHLTPQGFDMIQQLKYLNMKTVHLSKLSVRKSVINQKSYYNIIINNKQAEDKVH